MSSFAYGYPNDTIRGLAEGSHLKNTSDSSSQAMNRELAPNVRDTLLLERRGQIARWMSDPLRALCCEQDHGLSKLWQNIAFFMDSSVHGTYPIALCQFRMALSCLAEEGSRGLMDLTIARFGHDFGVQLTSPLKAFLHIFHAFTAGTFM
jgi:hypothetical protein